MNILVTGACGQLGSEMRVLSTRHPAHRYVFSDIRVPDDGPGTFRALDITSTEQVCALVQEYHIDLIVNCAAYTNVDRAEQEESAARRINAEAVAVLAAAGTRVIHISTDYVFSGDGCLPYREEDPVAPRTAYGRTKLEGEWRLIEALPHAIIFRTA